MKYLTGVCQQHFTTWGMPKGLAKWNSKDYSLDIAQAVYFAVVCLFFFEKGIHIEWHRNNNGCFGSIDGMTQYCKEGNTFGTYRGASFEEVIKACTQNASIIYNLRHQ